MVENNCSGPESLQTRGCMVGSPARDISLCLAFWSFHRNVSLRRPEGPTLGLIEENTGSSGRGEQQDALAPEFSPRLSFRYPGEAFCEGWILTSLWSGTVLSSTQSLVLSGTSQCTVMRAMVRLGPPDMSSRDSAWRAQLDRCPGH